MNDFYPLDADQLENSHQWPLLAAKQMPVAQKIVGAKEYQKHLTSFLQSPDRFPRWPIQLSKLTQECWSELFNFEYQMAISYQMQTTNLDWDMEELLNKLKVNAQDIHLLIAQSARLFKASYPVAELWARLQEMPTNSPQEKELALHLAQEFSLQKTTSGQSYYLINTIQDHLEIHQIDPLSYQCALFLKEESTSLSALVFEHFGHDGQRPLENVLAQLITLGAVGDWQEESQPLT